jgi:hypothetical protein
MFKKTYQITQLFSFVIIFFNSLLFSQEFAKNELSQPQSEFSFGGWYSGSKDFVEISYGLGKFKHKNISTEFNSYSLNEIKLGRRFVKPVAGSKIIEFNDDYLFSSYVDDNQSNTSEALNISYKIWRFGLGYIKGYGYNFRDFAIMPYYQMGLVWHESNFSHPYERIRTFAPDQELEIELKKINYYNDVIKFGSTNIAGIDIRLSSLIGIGAAYETSVIFPYHKFWKQLGSFFIETLAQTGFDFLTEGVIVKEIPSLTPIIYFTLKNGLSYLFYTNKQEKMNWPFETPAPLSMDTFKFSLKITF